MQIETYLGLNINGAKYVYCEIRLSNFLSFSLKIDGSFVM